MKRRLVCSLPSYTVQNLPIGQTFLLAKIPKMETEKIYRYSNKRNQARNKQHYTKLLLKCFYLNGNTFRFINKSDQTYHLTNMTGEKFISTADSRGSKVSQKSLTRVGVFIMISAFNQIVVCGLISLFF